MLYWAGFPVLAGQAQSCSVSRFHNLVKHKLVFALILNTDYSTVVPKIEQILDWLTPGNVTLLSHKVTNLHDSSLARRPLKAKWSASPRFQAYSVHVSSVLGAKEEYKEPLANTVSAPQELPA